MKINGKQRPQPPSLSEKNGGAAQGEYAKKEGGGNEVFPKKKEVFTMPITIQEYIFKTMKELLENSSNGYYLDFVMLIIAMLPIVIALKANIEYQELKPIIIHPIATILQSIAVYLTYSDFGNEHFYILNNLSQKLFTLIEGVVLFYFFIISTYTKSIKSILIITFLSYIIIYFINFPGYKDNHNLATSYWIQNIYLSLGAFLTTISIYQDKEQDKIESNPYFLISFGTLVLSICGIPLFIAKDILSKNHKFLDSNIFFLNFLLYILFFLIIAKALLCKKTKKQ